jgi:hypothetical protein
MIRKFFYDQANRNAGHLLYVSDFDELLKDMKRIDPEARKTFNKDTRNILLPYVNVARGFIPTEPPLSKWRTIAPTYTSATWEDDTKHRGRDANIRWVWDSADAKRGISITRGSFKAKGLTFDNVIGLKKSDGNYEVNPDMNKNLLNSDKLIVLGTNEQMTKLHGLFLYHRD